MSGAPPDPFRRHGGRLQAARLAFPAAPEPWIDLSTGVNPWPYPAPAPSRQALVRLPDPADLARLEATAARAFGVVDPARVVATAGAEAALRLLPWLAPARTVAIAGPTYGGHAEAWRAAGAEVAAWPELDPEREGEVVVMVNPNNPDGRRHAPADLLALADRLAARGGLLVVDESFVETAPELSVASAGHPAVVVLRSFGKAYGLPGVRLGFAVARPELAAGLRGLSGDWPVSAGALTAGLAAYADAAWLAGMRLRLRPAAASLDRDLAVAGFEIVGGTDLFRLARAPRRRCALRRPVRPGRADPAVRGRAGPAALRPAPPARALAPAPGARRPVRRAAPYARLALATLAMEAALGYPDALHRRLPHPVVPVGALIDGLERRWNDAGQPERVRKARGVAAALLVPAIAAVAGCGLARGLRGRCAAPLLALAGTVGLAQRSLHQHVAAVLAPLEAGDLAAARAAVGRIVGRDTAALDVSGVAAAALESLAESFNDGVVAPAAWLAVGGLPGLYAYKAINTADSLVGHREPRWRAYGWASARLDDAANLAPARLAGALIALAGGRGWRVMRRDAGKHASPNAGWPEAAMAGALGVRLGGPAAYDGVEVDRPAFGDGPPPTVADLRRGLALHRRACLLLWAFMGALSWRR